MHVLSESGDCGTRIMYRDLRNIREEIAGWTLFAGVAVMADSSASLRSSLELERTD